jgi:hypothetical protein
MKMSLPIIQNKTRHISNEHRFSFDVFLARECDCLKFHEALRSTRCSIDAMGREFSDVTMIVLLTDLEEIVERSLG